MRACFSDPAAPRTYIYLMGEASEVGGRCCHTTDRRCRLGNVSSGSYDSVKSGEGHEGSYWNMSSHVVRDGPAWLSCAKHYPHSTFEIVFWGDVL